MKKKNKNIKTQKAAKSTPKSTKQSDKQVLSSNPFADFWKLVKKGIVLLAVVVGCVAFTDWKGYFNPDYTNDHTRRKWDTYYQFTKSQPIDIVLVGNSHLYTGINPENLSNALGANCFILASPGTTMTDVYYSLKEAISVRKPRIAVIETFGINNYASHKMEAGALSDQFKSFSARKNIPQKLASTPVIFSSKNYLAAWSNTIRNHNFIFSDPEQIKRNKELMKKPQPYPRGLYLGRYIRFTSGLEEANLQKYEDGTVGFDCYKFTVGKEAERFVEKAIQLCKENDVIPVFLTLPMYYKHFNNPGLYTEKLAKVIAPYKLLWENQQTPYDYQAFSPDCFENTVAENQHMTYYGSLVSSYKLAHFIHSNLPNVLYNRSNDVSWKQLFYASDGYFQNHSPENDGISQILAKDEMYGNFKIKEIDLVSVQNYKQLLLKIVLPEGMKKERLPKTIDLYLEIEHKGIAYLTPIQVHLSEAVQPISFHLYESDPLNPSITASGVKW